MGDELAVQVQGRPLLEGVSLAVDRSEVVRLGGPSGVGKTSLLRVLAALDDPVAGTLTLDGRAPATLGVPTYRRQVVHLTQRPVMWPGSVRDNLSRAFGFVHAAVSYDEGAATSWLLQLGLALDLATEANRLSEGEKQRVALVRALLLQPRVLLLDEPTSALDADHRKRVEALLEERQVDGLAMVLVTHETEQAARMGARQIDLSAHRPRAMPIEEPNLKVVGDQP